MKIPDTPEDTLIGIIVDCAFPVYGENPCKKNYFPAPVLVIFLEGLIGPGGFVWAGNSSPWGLEWGVCRGGRAGFGIALCFLCGRVFSIG